MDYLEKILVNDAAISNDAIKEITQLRARVVELEQSLRRIVSYYDLAKTGSSFPAMTMQAMAEHENTMFGEARKVLKNGR